MPAGAWHSARFGAEGARIAIVRPSDASGAVAYCLDRLVQLRGRSLSWLAWRLAGELRASDTAAPLAAERLCSGAAGRRRAARRDPSATPAGPSLGFALQRRCCARGHCTGLTELANAVGVHPTHLARAFRARYGTSVGEYGRRVRLAWAAAELAPLRHGHRHDREAGRVRRPEPLHAGLQAPRRRHAGSLPSRDAARCSARSRVGSPGSRRLAGPRPCWSRGGPLAIRAPSTRRTDQCVCAMLWRLPASPPCSLFRSPRRQAAGRLWRPRAAASTGRFRCPTSSA